MSTTINGNNLVYIARSQGGIRLAAKEEVALDGSAPHTEDYFVQTEEGDTAIDHRKLYGKFISQYAPKPSRGDRHLDDAQKDCDYNLFQARLVEEKTDALLEEMEKLSPEQRALARERNGELESLSRYLEAQGRPLSTSEKLKLRYRSIAELSDSGRLPKEVGMRAKELFVLQSYNDSAWEYTSAKYGVPLPGGANPWNARGRELAEYTPAVESLAVRAEMVQRQRVQAMLMMSLFGSFSMGLFPFPFLGWM